MAIDFDRVTAWFKDKGVSTICPSCQASGFKISNEMAGVAQHEGGRVSLQVQVICRKCGHIRSFSAKAMGLTDD